MQSREPTPRRAARELGDQRPVLAEVWLREAAPAITARLSQPG